MKSPAVDPRQIEALMKSRSSFVRLVKGKFAFVRAWGIRFPRLPRRGVRERRYRPRVDLSGSRAHLGQTRAGLFSRSQ